MKCANCGNEDLRTLHDEGDTFYCSICCHRTQTATGQDDLITCPYCGRFRDRKAFQCLWCGNSIGQNEEPSIELYEEINEVLKDFETSLTPENKRFWNIRKNK